MNTWTVTDSNGMTHTISSKVAAFSGPQITVDGNAYRVKSGNWFVNVVDYSIDFPGVNCHLVMIGKKTRLAVNGTYQDDGTAYEPITSVPAWIWVLVGVSVIGGWFFGGILCCAIGAALSTVYITGALEKNKKKVVLAFVSFLVIAVLFLALNVFISLL